MKFIFIFTQQHFFTCCKVYENKTRLKNLLEILLNITKTKILKHPLKINIHEKYIPCKFKVGKKFVNIIRLLGKTTKIISMRAVHAKQLARRSCFLMKRCKFIFVDESRQRFFLCETKLKK